MRKARFPKGPHGDDAASAPFAMVAVVLLLSATMSYAYLAHLEASRRASEGLEVWTDGPLAALDRAEDLAERLAREALSEALDGCDGARSRTIVSTLSTVAGGGFADRVGVMFPIREGGICVTAQDPRVTVAPVYSTMVAGNALGQLARQQLPMGVQATASVSLRASTEDGSWAQREVVVREGSLAPHVLAAHLQNLLELALAEEGLVPMLMSEAISSKLRNDKDWAPEDGRFVNLLDAAIGTVERCLFRIDTGPRNDRNRVVPPGVAGRLCAPALLGVEGEGDVAVELPAEEAWDLVHPLTGEGVTVRLVPRFDWTSGPWVAVEDDDYLGSEAREHVDVTVLRLSLAGHAVHEVSIVVDGEVQATVTREMGVRTSIVGWAWDRGVDLAGRDYWDLPQVESWDDFEGTMAIVSPPSRTLQVELAEGLGEVASVSLDGVYLGEFGPGSVVFPNVPAGPHGLSVLPSGPDFLGSACHLSVSLPPDQPVTRVTAAPEEASGAVEEFAFWFSIMSACHRGDGVLPHLGAVAASVGFPPPGADIATDPAGHLADLAFWVGGLSRHLTHLGAEWVHLQPPAQAGCLELAMDLVDLTDLALTAMVELPAEAVRAGRVTILLTSTEGRVGFIARSSSSSGSIDILEGAEEAGEFIVRSPSLASTVVARVGNALTALAVVGSTLGVAFSAVELVEADRGGDRAGVLVAAKDLAFDVARVVLYSVKALNELGALALSAVSRSALSVVGAAIAVVATFLDAYCQAGSDFWGAWDLLLSPASFTEALRTAGFFSALTSLITTVVVTAALPSITGATIAGAFATAVIAATGVGLLVFGSVLALWAIINWDSIRSWLSGTADDEDVESTRKDLEEALGSTLDLRARLNNLEVDRELLEARAERGMALALMELGALSGDTTLVEALGGAGHRHLDGACARTRRVRSVVEVKYWIEVLWREIDDLIDNDRPREDGEDSEGFRDYRGSFGSQDHDFDADILVARNGSGAVKLRQADGTLVGFLRAVEEGELAIMSVRLTISGEVYGEGLDSWARAIRAIAGELEDSTRALAVASREGAFVASQGAASRYSRERGLVEIRTAAGVVSARVEVVPDRGAVLVGGKLEEGPQTLNVTNGTLFVVTTGGHLTSTVVGLTAMAGSLVLQADGDVPHWFELGFGSAVIDHSGG